LFEPKVFEFELEEKFPNVEGLPKFVFPKVEVLLLVFPKVVPPPPKLLFDELLLLFPKELLLLLLLLFPKDVLPKPPKVFDEGDAVLFKPKEKVVPELLLLFEPKVVKAWLFELLLLLLLLLLPNEKPPEGVPKPERALKLKDVITMST